MNNTFVKAKIFGVNLPALWPSNKSFYEEWNTIKEHFNIQLGVDINSPFSSWDINECLKWICNNPFYQPFIQDPEHLEVIVRGDSAPVGGKKASFLLLTLGNFGLFSKCVSFNFLVNLAEVCYKLVKYN